MYPLSELCSIFSMMFSCPYTTVYQYARRLQVAGMLPTTKGRAVEPVAPDEVLALFLALCLRPKYSETAETVKPYLTLRHDGVPDRENVPDQLKETFLDRLRFTLITVVADPSKLSANIIGFQRAEANLEYEINLDFPEVLIRDDDALVEVFKNEGIPGRRTARFRRSVSFHGMIFEELDDYADLFEISDEFMEKFQAYYAKFEG